jgi:hypothetical protein
MCVIPVQFGDNATETGYLRLTSYRIPRTWMLMKNAVVSAGKPSLG